MQAAVPAQLPQSTVAPNMDVVGRIAAAAAGGQAVGANDLALWQQIYQMVAHSALASAAGHQSYPAVLQPGPAAHLPALATTAVLPAALLSPATLQPPSSVAQLPVTQLPPALAAAQCDAASTPVAAQPALAAILPAATSPAAAAQLPAAQPPGLGSVLPASRPDPWTEGDPWIRPSGQQPQPALQPAAQPFASPPDLAATTAASYVAQPAAAAEPPDPWERAYPGASRAPHQPPPSQHGGQHDQRQVPSMQQQAAVAQSASRTQERRIRSEARRALQAERLQDEWERLETIAILAQRVEAGGETAIHEIARERRLEPGDVRKWHRAWAAAIAGPTVPSRW